MKKFYSLILSLIIFSISLSFSQEVLLAKQTKFNPKKSSVTFSITHLLINKVTGNFDDFDFSLDLDKNTIKKFQVQLKQLLLTLKIKSEIIT